MSSYKYNPDGSERTFDQLPIHKLFQIPPNFEALHPENRPDSAGRSRKMVDPKDARRFDQLKKGKKDSTKN